MALEEKFDLEIPDKEAEKSQQSGMLWNILKLIPDQLHKKSPTLWGFFYLMVPLCLPSIRQQKVHS